MGWLLFLVPIAGAGALAFVAMTRLRERDEQAAIFISAGAGGFIVFALARRFLEGTLPPMLFWIADEPVFVASVGAVVFGFMKLFETVNPKHGRPLPAVLNSAATHKPNLFVRGFFGFFGVMGILANMGRFIDGGGGGMLVAGGGIAALVAVLAGSYFIDKQGAPHLWVLQRRPDLIVWCYTHQLTVVNRKTGSRTVHWSAQMGLQTGMLVGIPASSQLDAQTIAAGVHELKPGIMLGYSPENLAKFQLMSKAPVQGEPPRNTSGPGGITTL
ncbi:MAG: hypothetical protein QM817_35445 [Archangium sp.]